MIKVNSVGTRYALNAFIMLLVVCLNNSCSKKENDKVKGKVVDHEKAIPFVHVQLQYWSERSNANKAYYKDVNADAN